MEGNDKYYPVRNIQPAEISKIGDWFIVTTFVDLAKKTGGFVYFKTQAEAEKWRHDISLGQFPDWHKEKCDQCSKSSER